MRRLILSTAGGALLLAAIAGCAASRTATPEAAKSPDQTAAAGLPPGLQVTPAFAPIARDAFAQMRRPIRETRDLPPPPGLPVQLANPVPADTDEGRRARTGLSSRIAELDGKPERSASPEVDPQIRELALRRYIEGRQKLLAGQAAAAIDDLREAADLDPAAGEPMRELGEAQLALGHRPEALRSFREAEERGLEEPRLLELLGRDALERGETETAARYFARSLKAGAASADPLLGPLVYVQLAKALAQDGYLLAARQAIREAFDGAGQLTSTTRYSAEFGAIYRRQGELWREAGDLDLRLGAYESALEAYARCSVLPVMDGVDIAPRLVFAACEAGRPAAGAIFLLEGLAARSGRIDEDHAALLGHLGKSREVGRSIASALANFRSELKREGRLSPTAVRHLARLEAALLPPEQARERLRVQLADDADDLGSIVALLESYADSRSAAREAAHLAAQNPTSAPAVAEALLRIPVAVTEADLLAAGPGEGALVAAYRAHAKGDPRHGLELLDRAGNRLRNLPAFHLARAQLAVAGGRPSLAKQSTDALGDLKGPEALLARARILHMLQRTRAAREAMAPVLELNRSGPQRLTDLLLAADFDMHLRRFDSAEALLAEAARIDPAADDVYSALIELHGTLRQDASKLNQLVRQIRQELPDGRAMRVLRAREFLRRGMASAAEQEALELIEEQPSDIGYIRLLVGIWEQEFRSNPAAAAEARNWVERQLERRGNAPGYLLALAAIEIGAQSAASAEPRLREALEETGSPDVSRILERLLREALSKKEEADTLTLARLEGRDRTPAESFELAEFYARRNETLRAVEAVRSAMEEADTLTPEQGRMAAVIAAVLGKQAADANQVDNQAVAAWLFDRLVERDVAMAPEEHEVRLVLLARDTKASIQQLIDAAILLGDQHPALRGPAFARLSLALVSAQQPGRALEMLSRAAENPAVLSPEMLFEWFRVIALAGEARDLRPLLDKADTAGQVSGLVRRLNPESVTGGASEKAELAYLLGNFMASLDRSAEAEHAYALTLEIDPRHAWAANNLGYYLTEQNRDFPRAATLLEMAHRELPGEPSITDSLGWLRYKQGLLSDFEDESGKHKGAVTLLEEAAATEYGSQNPVILDHLGDALYVAGRRTEAMHYWQLAQNWAARQLREARSSAERTMSETTESEYRDIVARTGLKRSTVGTGQWVPVAPQANNPRPSPPPSHEPEPLSPAKADAPAADSVH